MKRTFALSVLAVTLGALCVMARSFEVGEKDFLLDGKPFVVRCGEVHYARIPRAYWRHRLQMLRAMGCNAVGCYMFWNFHEREKGVFTWDGRADVAAFCRMAQTEGLWVILRPGPYSCAEWEGGGAPWWLMGEGELGTGNGERRKPISMRSSDPRWLVPATNWLHAVGRQLSGQQVTKGGPILMVQVENEYGLHGGDVAYMRALRQAALDAGFEVPLYACNPPRVMQNGFIPELFQAANFGGDPEQRFEIVRKYQPKGPLMCAEYYPAWFDTWGQAHHLPKNDRAFFGPIDWMFAPVTAGCSTSMNSMTSAMCFLTEFPSGATLTLNSYAKVRKIFTDGTLTLAGNGNGGIQTTANNNTAPLTIGGTGLIRLAGVNIIAPYATGAVNARTEITNAIEIVEGTTNIFRIATGSSRYSSLHAFRRRRTWRTDTSGTIARSHLRSL